ncbi:MAG: glutamate ligase domain-containing protein, partial [Thermodesulfobacteriota bacterium]
PLMGEVAGRLGDVIVLTSDNPRSEDPENILEDIEKGLSGQPVHRADCGLTYLRVQSEKGVYSIVQDRGRAIKEVIAFSQPGDVVVICGKGHESYQTGRLGTVFFNDRLEAIRALNRVDQTC